ncbi:MAG: PEP-CTERM sorting domain-containing protein [Pirellula sp.]|nr:PEP-CTERM sorting domain-containing protein [Pirellula sp.]
MARVFLVALVFCGYCAVSPFAHANPIVGTIGFNVDGQINPPSGNLNLGFEISDIVTNNTADGDWAAFTNGTPVTSLMQFGDFPSNGSTFSFSDPGFGTFEGTVEFDSGQFGSPLFSQRQIIVVGGFTPGSTLTAQGFTDLVNGQLSVIIQSIGNGGRSSSIVFGTAAVPEPASIALVALGISALATGRGIRRRRSNAPVL